jgi:maspardin
VDEWCRGFRQLLSHLDVEKVHIFGAALGGFLAQKFAEFTRPCPRVASLILCNTFTDTTVFKYADQSQMFWLLPGAVLRSLVSHGIDTQSDDNSIVKASAFMYDRLGGLEQSVLASRLSVNCNPSYVQPQSVNDLPVTIMNVFDDCALSEEVGYSDQVSLCPYT